MRGRVDRDPGVGVGGRPNGNDLQVLALEHVQMAGVEGDVAQLTPRLLQSLGHEVGDRDHTRAGDQSPVARQAQPATADADDANPAIPSPAHTSPPVVST
jgi:hypothetical protein